MPWVRLDDRFPSHRKVALLSDRAFRLHVSALCWASENLTEGKILDRELPVIARIRGIKATAKELEAAGLWDRAEGGWTIHDYLEYNPDRAKVQAEREANALRQQAWRDRKKAEKEAKAAAEKAVRNAARNGVTDSPSEHRNDTTATATRHDGDTNAEENRLTNQQSPQVSEIRNAVNNGTPSRPVPPSPSEKEKEEETASYARSPEPPRIGDRPRIPAASQPLVDELERAGLVVGWDLDSAEWFLIEALIQRCTIPRLVVSARSSWQGARKQPRRGNYFIPAWRVLADAPAQPEAEQGYLPAAVGDNVHQLPDPSQRPSVTDARVNQAIEAGRRMQALADAKRAQEQS
ncbi:hypothetical protein [Streptomyces sp. NRRL F-5123]|uniref:hypothetical protein n=1 Tax=Streptomyces sp. NRRL F-5123 TaxID=1463856 RepID=UPI0004E1882A|nr:hypothetical protein [Streptomyces sp. NRRL F-5123]